MSQEPQPTQRPHAPHRGERNGNRASRRIMPAPGDVRTSQIGSRPVKSILAALSALTLVVGGIGYTTVGSLNNQLAQAGNLNLGSSPDGATDILLVGIDSRTDAQGNPLTQKEINMLRAGEEEATNTDTMILIRVPNDGSGATAVSLPRDTYVATENMGNMKLNGVYGSAKFNEEEKAFQEATEAGKSLTDEDKRSIEARAKEAGRQALINTVANLTGINVDHYAEIGLLGFVLLTDAVGGVDVCLNNAVNEPLSGAKFKAGRQTLNGPNALSFVRQRHGLPRGDLDRITRQQAYMASLVNHILSSKTLTDPSSLGRINAAVQRSVVLDSNWDVMGLATQMQGLAGGNVKFQTIPVTSIDGTGDYGESIVTVDREQVRRFFEKMLNADDQQAAEDAHREDKSSSDKSAGDKGEDIPEFNAKDYTVNVFNASETAGLAARVGKLTQDYGYRAGTVGNSPSTGVSESQVNAKDVNDPAARALARQLGGLQVVEDKDLPDKHLSVTLSGTYYGPGSIEPAVPLTDPNDPNAGTLTAGMRDLDGDGIPDEDSGEGTGNGEGSGSSGSVVGTPGTLGPDGRPIGQGSDGSVVGKKPTESIDAGGDGPMCVN